MDGKARIIAIDGTSLAYRAFYALPRLATSSGRPTGATLGFCNMLLRLLEDYEPLTIVVAFDHPKKTFRHALEERYKVSRKPMPDLLRPQLEDIKEILRLFGFPVLEVPGFEGDDLIGSLKEQLGGKYTLFIVSSDLDLLQLLDENTVLLQPVQGVTRLRLLRSEDLVTELGITPAQVVDFLALSGDASDDIPGIQGIGEKRAAKLLQRFGNLEGILAHVDELPPALRENLLAFRERIAMNRILATIRRDVPIACSIEPWSFSRVDWSALFRKLEELELKKLRERMEKRRHATLLMLQGRELSTLDGEDPPQEGVRYLVSVVAPDGETLDATLETPGVFWSPVLCFLSHPVLFPFSKVLECIRGNQIPRNLVTLFESARAWIERQPLLFWAYRNVEVPLARDLFLGKVVFCSTPFPELPLFGPPLVFRIRCVVPFQSLEKAQREDAFLALPTLYGWRFVGREEDPEATVLAAYRNVLEEEIVHLLVWALEKKGARRFALEPQKLCVEMYGVGDLESVLCEAFCAIPRDRWRVTAIKGDSGVYELLVTGEGG